MKQSIFIGWDPREADAFAVARESIIRNLSIRLPVYGLVLSVLKAKGLYYRPMEIRASAADRPVMWDVISQAPMSTEHACARFLVPYLAQSGWALFMDGDMLVRADLRRLFDKLDEKYAVYCVKHFYPPNEDTLKMDGQIQTVYYRKNWSSFCVFNVSHPANKPLRENIELANTLPGRDLHRFCWLNDDHIGSLDPEWNFLIGHSAHIEEPKVVHFTTGIPSMPGYENCAFADEWRIERDRWALGKAY